MFQRIHNICESPHHPTAIKFYLETNVITVIFLIPCIALILFWKQLPGETLINPAEVIMNLMFELCMQRWKCYPFMTNQSTNKSLKTVQNFSSGWFNGNMGWGWGMGREKRNRTLRNQMKIKSVGSAWLLSLHACNLFLPRAFFRTPLPSCSAYGTLPGQAGSQEAADGKGQFMVSSLKHSPFMPFSLLSWGRLVNVSCVDNRILW